MGFCTDLTDPLGHVTRRDSDRLGRLSAVHYLNESPKLTPDVAFIYDLAGSRTGMVESDGVNPVRQTSYAYDRARRLTSVGFDTDGDGVVEQAVSYEYDAGGLRTKLTLPGGLSVTYVYDAKGQLVDLVDWDGQGTRYAYDLAGRLIAAERSNGLRTRYTYDAGGRLRLLKHTAGSRALSQFAYEVNALGNRISAYECLPHPGAGETTIASTDPAVDYYRGAWIADGDLRYSTNISAALRIAFFGNEATLTLGVGPDYGICDVYVNGAFWQSFDNYAASAGEDAISLAMQGEGPHILEIRNRSEKNQASSGYRVAFRSLAIPFGYDLHTIQYTYDALSRIASANYYPGVNVGATPFRTYAYAFDLAGNCLQEIVNGTPTNYTYNALNQIISGGVTYDANGNMTSDGAYPMTWDRANRLLSYRGVANAYNGLGQRVSQTVDSVVTEYLLDVQPGLWVTLAEVRGSDTTRFVHGPRGMQAQQQPDGAWLFPVQDALGSVRAIIAQELGALGKQHFAPYGVPFGLEGVLDTSYGFTGEQASGSELLYLRARHYAPVFGAFTGLDPLEVDNRYAYVSGNTVNLVDPSGMIYEAPLNECGDASQWLDPGCNQYCGTQYDRYIACILNSNQNPANWSVQNPRNPWRETGLWFPGMDLGYEHAAYLRRAMQHWDECVRTRQQSPSCPDVSPNFCWNICRNNPCAYNGTELTPEETCRYTPGLTQQFFRCVDRCVNPPSQDLLCDDQNRRNENTDAVFAELPFIFPELVPLLPDSGNRCRSALVRTRGLIVGLEADPVAGVTPALGGALSVLFEGNSWHDWDINRCRVLFTGEAGVGGAVPGDVSQVPIALLWSTATLSEATGIAINFSGDLGIGRLGLSVGVSWSTGCNTSLYVSPFGTGFNFSGTLGLAVHITYCSEAANLVSGILNLISSIVPMDA